MEWGGQGVISLWCAAWAPQHLCWLLSAPWGLLRSSAEAESSPLAHGQVHAPHLPLWAEANTWGWRRIQWALELLSVLLALM